MSRDNSNPKPLRPEIERMIRVAAGEELAIKQGDVETGKQLLREAIDTNPQHFDEAVRALQALENA